MKKLLCCILICSMLAGCYSYKDMNRLLFFTMGAIDLKEDSLELYGETFKGYRGEGEKVGEEKRVVIYGKGKSISEAASEMRNTVNYPVDYAGSKAIILSKALAEHGVADILDIYNRDQKPSLRQYIIVYDGKIEELMSVTMEDEQFLGLYLYELMNTQKQTYGVITAQYYQFLDQMSTGSLVNVVPMMKLSTIYEESGSSEENSGQKQEDSNVGASNSSDSKNMENSLSKPYIMIDGAAIFIKDKVACVMSQAELETYKFLTSPIKSGLMQAQNPEFEDKKIEFSILASKSKHKVKMENDRIKVKYTINTRVVLEEAQKGIDAGNEDMLEKIKKSLKDTLQERSMALYESMKSKGVDILDVGRDLESRSIKIGEEQNLLELIDFELDINIRMDGTGLLKEAYY